MDMKAYNDKYQIEHRDDILAQRKKYYYENRRRLLDAHKEYMQTEKGKAAKKRADYKHKHSNKFKLNKQLYRIHLKIISLQIYSNGTMRCKNCGFDDIDCLSLDHIHNNGNKLRKQFGYHRDIHEWVYREHYPSDFQVLCRNCNWKKYMELKGEKK